MLKRDIRQKYIDMQFQELHIRETIVAENMKKFLEIDKFYQSVDTVRQDAFVFKLILICNSISYTKFKATLNIYNIQFVCVCVIMLCVCVSLCPCMNGQEGSKPPSGHLST